MVHIFSNISSDDSQLSNEFLPDPFKDSKKGEIKLLFSSVFRSLFSELGLHPGENTTISYDPYLNIIAEHLKTTNEILRQCGHDFKPAAVKNFLLSFRAYMTFNHAHLYQDLPMRQGASLRESIDASSEMTNRLTQLALSSNGNQASFLRRLWLTCGKEQKEVVENAVIESLVGHIKSYLFDFGVNAISKSLAVDLRDEIISEFRLACLAPERLTEVSLLKIAFTAVSNITHLDTYRRDNSSQIDPEYFDSSSLDIYHEMCGLVTPRQREIILQAYVNGDMPDYKTLEEILHLNPFNSHYKIRRARDELEKNSASKVRISRIEDALKTETPNLRECMRYFILGVESKDIPATPKALKEYLKANKIPTLFGAAALDAALSQPDSFDYLAGRKLKPETVQDLIIIRRDYHLDGNIVKRPQFDPYDDSYFNSKLRTA